MSSSRPTRPIESYPAADLGDLPQPPAPEGGAVAAPVAGPVEGAGPTRQPEADAAVLEFLDPSAVFTTSPVQYAFKWEGRPVTEIEIHRLSGAEVGRLADLHGDRVELFDFYAAMARLPKAVLRALIDDDLEVFLKKARPFLCPFAREAFFSPTGESGAPSPAAPAEPSGSPGPAS